MNNKYYYIYIMASESGTLYIGITNNLEKRIWEHKQKLIDGFTKKYDCKKLVYNVAARIPLAFKPGDEGQCEEKYVGGADTFHLKPPRYLAL